MTTQVESFKDNLIEAGVLDPVGIHHEFVSGMHGRKLDFDKIETGSDLYGEWVDVTTDFIAENYENTPGVILGVANGTNRLALDIGRRFEGLSYGAVSEKDEVNSKVLRLSQAAAGIIKLMKPSFVLVVEDVGTTGSNSVQVAKYALDAGAQEVEVLTTWQRRPQLERLMEAGVPYRAIIDEALPTFSPEECVSSGFCAEGSTLIPRAE